MLFDLRSRGRRRTVQVVYIGLAILIGLGLVGFGVGTGGGGGGIFGALSSDNSGNGSNSTNTKEVSAAVKRTQQQPQSAAAWANLVTVRSQAANGPNGLDSQTSTYTAAGKQQLGLATKAYEKYATLIKKPGVEPTILAARAYGQIGQYAKAATAWQGVAGPGANGLKGFECVAMNSYAAKNTRVAQLAEAKTLSRVPKAERKQFKTAIESAKTQPTIVAQQC